MTNTVAGIHLGPGDHANRPSATAVTAGTLYSCTDHSLIYVSDGSAWSTWATLGGGGGTAGLVLLDTQSVSGSDATITFSSISGSYKDLLIVGRLRSDRSGVEQDQTVMQVGNGSVDTGSNYRYTRASIDQSGTSGSEESTSATSMQLTNVSGATADANTFSMFEAKIFDYADTSYWRVVQAWGGGIVTSVPIGTMMFGSGVWKNAVAAIDTIKVAPRAGTNFKVGSKLRLYGMQ